MAKWLPSISILIFVGWYGWKKFYITRPRHFYVSYLIFTCKNAVCRALTMRLFQDIWHKERTRPPHLSSLQLINPLLLIFTVMKLFFFVLSLLRCSHCYFIYTVMIYALWFKENITVLKWYILCFLQTAEKPKYASLNICKVSA